MERDKLNPVSHRYEPYTFAIRASQRTAKNCKRVCLANAQNQTKLKHRINKQSGKASG